MGASTRDLYRCYICLEWDVHVIGSHTLERLGLDGGQDEGTIVLRVLAESIQMCGE